MESIIGALYAEKGPSATKEFIKKHILSRAVDVDAHIDLFVKLRKPRVLLKALTKSLNKPSPIARYRQTYKD
jgi:dsRNA-specific ribonuclease